MSRVYGGAVRGVRRFANRFGHRRMRVNGANELVDGRFEPYRHGRFRDELSRARADHMHAEQRVGGFIGHDFYEAFRLASHLRASEHAERKRADANVMSTLFRLALSQTDAADFRIAVRATW